MSKEMIEYILQGGRPHYISFAGFALHISVVFLVCLIFYYIGVLLYNLLLNVLNALENGRAARNENRSHGHSKKNISVTGIVITFIVALFIYLGPPPDISLLKGDNYNKIDLVDINNYNIYNSSSFISTTLNKYLISTEVPTYNKMNTIEFIGRTIPIPFDLTDIEISAKDDVVVIYNDNSPCLAVFVEGAQGYTSNWPELNGNVQMFLQNAIIVTYESSPFGRPLSGIPYSKKVKYLNTVPALNEDGVPGKKDMRSDAIIYKRGLEDIYSEYYGGEFTVMSARVSCSNINVLLYQTPAIKIIEIYEYDLHRYTIAIPGSIESGEYINYIITYLDCGCEQCKGS